MDAERRQKLDAKARRQPSRLELKIPAGATPEQIAAEEARQERIRGYQRRTAMEEYRRTCRVPKHYAAASLDDVAAVPPENRGQYREVCDALRSLLEHPVVLALIGPRGPGKTHMACGLINAFVAAARPAVYATAADVVASVRGTWGGGAGADEKMLMSFVTPHLLVLDEFHERRETNDEGLMLTRVVDKRYAANRATVIIANQDEETFVARAGTSISDRINDGGGILVCDWPSLRGRLGSEVA